MGEVQDRDKGLVKTDLTELIYSVTTIRNMDTLRQTIGGSRIGVQM